MHLHILMAVMVLTMHTFCTIKYVHAKALEGGGFLLRFVEDELFYF